MLLAHTTSAASPCSGPGVCLSSRSTGCFVAFAKMLIGTSRACIACGVTSPALAGMLTRFRRVHPSG